MKAHHRGPLPETTLAPQACRDFYDVPAQQQLLSPAECDRDEVAPPVKTDSCAQPTFCRGATMTCVEAGHQELNSPWELRSLCATPGKGTSGLPMELPLTTTLAPVLAQSRGIPALPLKLTGPQTG